VETFRLQISLIFKVFPVGKPVISKDGKQCNPKINDSVCKNRTACVWLNSDKSDNWQLKFIFQSKYYAANTIFDKI